MRVPTSERILAYVHPDRDGDIGLGSSACRRRHRIQAADHLGIEPTDLALRAHLGKLRVRVFHTSGLGAFAQ